ncbi:MAG: imelysin family protein [Myxococcota bacterium]
MTFFRPLMCLALLLASCSGDEAPTEEFDLSTMLSQLGENVFLPTYRDAASAAEALESAATTYCAAPSDAGLSALEDAFRSAHVAFRAADAFAYGPHTDRPERFGPKIDEFPVETADVQELLTSTDGLALEDFQLRGNRTQGFTVLDYLIFSSEDEVGSWSGRRCEYVVGQSGRVREITAGYVQAWSPEGGDHLGEMVRGEGRYPGVFTAASIVMEQLKFGLEFTRAIRVGKPFGERDAGRLQLDQFEAPNSRGSLAAVRRSVESARSVYLGRYEDRAGQVRDGLGVQDWVGSFRTDLDGPTLAEFDAVIAAIDAIEPDLETAVENDGPAIQNVLDAFRELEATIQVDLAAAVGVSITFSPVDGD